MIDSTSNPTFEQRHDPGTCPSPSTRRRATSGWASCSPRSMKSAIPKSREPSCGTGSRRLPPAPSPTAPWWASRAAIRWPWLLVPLLQSCIVVPRTIEVYDPECQVVARHMDLQTVQVGYISRCSNESCAALVVAAAATVTVTAIISGSIVVIGNTAYWFQKQGRCLRGPE